MKDRTADSATLSFAAPASDGGAPISGYVVEMKARLETKWKLVAKDVQETAEFRATGLSADVEYEFRVAAVNKAGPGQASPPSKPAKYGTPVLRNPVPFYSAVSTRETGGSVAEWSACWTRAQKGPGSSRSRDAVG